MSKERDKIIEALEDISIKFDELGFSPTIPIPKGDKAHFVDWFKIEIDTIKVATNKQAQRIAELEEQLAESENLKENYDILRCQHKSLGEFCDELKQQLKEKDNEHAKEMMAFEKKCQAYYNSKGFAVEQLEKVKTKVRNLGGFRKGEKLFINLDNVVYLINELKREFADDPDVIW